MLCSEQKLSEDKKTHIIVSIQGDDLQDMRINLHSKHYRKYSINKSWSQGKKELLMEI